MTIRAILTFVIAGIMSLAASAASLAADLVIALKNPPATLDPHFMTSPSAAQINILIFEPLIRRNASNGIDPGLAESWEVVNDKTWVFKLRKNVKFSDGTPFTAHDVVFTYDRAQNVPNAPSSFKTYLNQVAKAEAIDDHTLRITTHDPAPTLLGNLCTVLIVSKKHGEKAGTDDYNSGKALVGTGPYLFESWSINDQTTLKARPDYWGGKMEWDRVTYKMITTDSSRVAALLTGDVDVIESVPVQEIARLKTNPAVNIVSRESSRIAYLSIDTGPEALTTSSRLSGPNGEKLDKNPLADPRVREALKISLDTDSFVKRIYQGEAAANGQYLPASAPGFNPDLKPWKQDEATARKLMEESGWAGKWKIEIGVSSTVFQNAVQAAEGIAQAWNRIGVAASVGNMPYPVFLDNRVKRTMPVYLQSFQNQSGTAEFLYPTLLHTRAGNYGSLNFARYSNPELDKLIEAALSNMNDAERAKQLQQAAVIAVKDAGVIPLWVLSEATGTKKNIEARVRVDRFLMPQLFSLKK